MANIQNVALVDRGKVVTGGGSGGHTIINESGTSLAQEPNLQFKGADISDDSTNNRTVVDMSYTEIDYEDWLELTEQEKETGRWDVVGVPGADGTVSFDLMTKLWENSSPTQAMASGISIALSESVNNFDFLLAIFRFSTTVVNNFAVIGNVGVTLQSNVQAGGNNANRVLTYTDSTHFTSGKGWSGSTEDSTRAIPLAIYGIKISQTVEIKAIAPEVSTSASKCMMSDGETSVEDVLNYSTDEHVIGKWIDGKTLYEKTVSCGALPNATTKSVDMGISDTLDTVWLSEGFAMVSSTGSSVPLPNVSTNATAGISGQTQIILRKATKKIEINTGTDRRDFDSSYITIRYTKATS